MYIIQNISWPQAVNDIVTNLIYKYVPVHDVYNIYHYDQERL